MMCIQTSCDPGHSLATSQIDDPKQPSGIQVIGGIILYVRVTVETLRISPDHAGRSGIRTGPTAAEAVVLSPPRMIETRSIIAFHQPKFLSDPVSGTISL